MEPASVGLGKILSQALRQTPDEAPVLVWPLACGAAVAERTKALSFADGVLRVEVPDRAWREQLAELASRYLPILNQYGANRVRVIEFVAKGQNTAGAKAPVFVRRARHD
jgi:predicted nucleic acid-binding Zn ribbon protein